MKDKIKLISVAVLVFVLMVLFAMSVSNLIGNISKEVTPYLERSAQCNSLGGEYGSDKCFVNGKEVVLNK